MGLIQKQLDAYNAKDIEGLVACYSPTVQAYNFPDAEPMLSGVAALRTAYQTLFAENPNLNSELINRMVEGATVIDQEFVTGFSARPDLRAVVIYAVVDQLIQKVWFIK